MGKELSHFHNMEMGTITYPSILVDNDYPEYLPILMDAMGEGDLPVVVVANEEIIELSKRIRKSPSVISILLDMYPIIVLKDKDTRIKIKNIRQLLEVGDDFWK